MPSPEVRHGRVDLEPIPFRLHPGPANVPKYIFSTQPTHIPLQAHIYIFPSLGFWPKNMTLGMMAREEIVCGLEKLSLMFYFISGQENEFFLVLQRHHFALPYSLLHPFTHSFSFIHSLKKDIFQALSTWLASLYFHTEMDNTVFGPYKLRVLWERQPCRLVIMAG